jgi:hypothetical protein
VEFHPFGGGHGIDGGVIEHRGVGGGVVGERASASLTGAGSRA